jgi:hypothetical protein
MFPKPGCPCLFSPRPCSWPLNVPDGRGLKDWVGRSQQAAQVLPHAPTGRHRHPDPAVQRALNRTTVLSTVPSNWVRSEQVLDARPSY